MMELITVVTVIINIVVGWYILFTIPSRLNKIIKQNIDIIKK